MDCYPVMIKIQWRLLVAKTKYNLGNGIVTYQVSNRLWVATSTGDVDSGSGSRLSQHSSHKIQNVDTIVLVQHGSTDVANYSTDVVTSAVRKIELPIIQHVLK